MAHPLRYHYSRQQLPLVFLLLSFLSMVSVQSQENSKDAIGSWMVFSMDNQLSERWSIPIIGILSYENWAEQTEFGFIRTGVSHNTNPNLELTMGFAYVDSQPLDHHEFETLTTQFWLYEEVTVKTGIHFKHRLRLENRWINKPTENLFNLRFRYRLEFKQKLTSTLFLKCTNEPFFNFEGLHIDQNRFFLGVESKIAKDLSMEVGYFKTHVGKDNFDRIRVVLHLRTSIFQKDSKNLTFQKIDKSSK